MANVQILEYIKNAKARSYSDAQIVNSLTSSGWGMQDINAALNEYYSKQGKPTTINNQKKDIGHLQRIKLLFLHPGEFFDLVEDEKGYKKPLMYAVIASVIVSFLNTIISALPLFSSPLGGFALGGLGLIIPLFLVFGIGFTFALPFLAAGMVHLGVMMFGGKKGYFNTFKPITYAIVIGSLYTLISSIIQGVLTMTIAKPIYNAPSLGFPMAGALGPSIFVYAVGIIIGLASFVHLTIIEVIGVSKYHNISKGKAFWGVIIIPLIIVMLLVPLIVFGSLAYFGVLSPAKFLPERCMGPAGLDCLDKASINSNGELGIVLKNNIGEDISIDESILATDNCVNGVLVSINGINSFPVDINKGEQATIRLNCDTLRKGSFKSDITLTYLNKGSGLKYPESVSITSEVK